MFKIVICLLSLGDGNLNAELKMENEFYDHPDLIDPNQNFTSRRHVRKERRISGLHAYYENAVDHVCTQAKAHQDVEYHERMVKYSTTSSTLTLRFGNDELKEVSDGQGKYCEIRQ